MKIAELNLIAFGPFENKVIRLDAGQEGLHIIFGPNEAGKSTTLRALIYWLFGFPQQAPDAYQHPYDRLRIGGSLRRQNGEQLSFIRRKGRINTLREPDDIGVIEESCLKSFLGGIEKEVFTSMFGIDHAGLIQGGQEIIRGGGDVGRILFAAGAGISDFQKILLDLQIQADNLFRPSAQKPKINEHLSVFRDKRKEISEVEINSGDWSLHDKALRDAEHRKHGLENERLQKTGEKHRLDRILEALPIIAERKECLSEYELVKTAVLLPEEFSKRRREVAENLKVWESRQHAAAQKRLGLQQKLAAQEAPERLLQQADAVQELLQELGSIRKADKDRLRLEGLLSSVRADAHTLLKELRHDLTLNQADKMRPEKRQVVRLRELAGQYDKLMARQESTRDQLRDLNLRRARIQEQLQETPPPPDLSALKEVCESIQQQGDLEQRYQSLGTDVQKVKNAIAAALPQIPFWQGTAADLEQLRPPLLETIDAAEDQRQRAQTTLTELEKELNQTNRRYQELSDRLQQLELAGEIPSEADLERARSRRDQGWSHLRRQWETGLVAAAAAAFIAAYPPAQELPDAYERSVAVADSLSDRLRREADRVAQKAGLIVEREKISAQQRLDAEKRDAAKAAAALAQQNWEDIWRPLGVTPKSPREMRSWLQKYTAVMEQLRLLRERQTEADEWRQRLEEARQSLLRACLEFNIPLAKPDSSLNRLLTAAKTMMAAHEKNRAAYLKLTADWQERNHEWQEAQARAQALAEALTQWRTQWAEVVAPLGLPQEATTAEASAVMDALNELFNKLKEMDGYEKRIAGIDRDRALFVQKVKLLVAREASDLASLPPEQAMTELNVRLTRGIKAKSTADTLHKTLMDEEKLLAQADSALLEIRAAQAALCREAGAETPEFLIEAEARSARRRNLEANLSRLDQQLRKLSAGAIPEAFIHDAGLEDPDAIPSRIAALNEALQTLDDEKSALNQAIGSERSLLAQNNGGAKAAELEEECQRLLAGLETDIEHYIRLKLAAEILGLAIERYREKNQGPLLSCAEQLFSRMTLGSFEGLRLEPGENAAPTLVGVRAKTRAMVPVSGMSDGSADQLYLAIRLASLEAWLKKNESMPFIVDDIMVMFDDQRAAETMKILAEFSRQTQIIFFTHHQHLVHLAQAHIDPNRLWIHELHGA